MLVPGRFDLAAGSQIAGQGSDGQLDRCADERSCRCIGDRQSFGRSELISIASLATPQVRLALLVRACRHIFSYLAATLC